MGAVEQKIIRMNISQALLERFKRNESDFFAPIHNDEIVKIVGYKRWTYTEKVWASFII